METKQHRPNINEPIMVFGMEFTELATVTGVMVTLMFATVFINAYIKIFGGLFYAVLFIFYIGLILLLRFGNRQGERQFLISFLSYYIFQPKHIRFYGKPKPTHKK